MSSMVSTGNAATLPPPEEQRRKPYVLAITSHKGGTGRTTLALALAWLWGKRGLKVTLVDADPIKATSLVASGASGLCPWENVRLVSTNGGLTKIPTGQDVIIIDTPPATEPLSQQVLVKAHGVVVCTLADTLSLNTLPKATAAIREARESNDDLELLGIAVGVFDQTDLAQTRALTQLRGNAGPLLLEPVIPLRNEIREWPLMPGSELPEGPGRQAIRKLEENFRDRMAEAGWEQFTNKNKGEYGAYATRR
jgi:cellulose biosynthesis protein BcsQ